MFTPQQTVPTTLIIYFECVHTNSIIALKTPDPNSTCGQTTAGNGLLIHYHVMSAVDPNSITIQDI